MDPEFAAVSDLIADIRSLPELQGVGDVDALMEQIRRQQAEVEGIQRSVEAMEITGASRHNEVQVTARGNGEVTDVSIDPDAIDQYNADELGECLKQAVNDALRRVREASAARFRPVIEAASRIEGL